MAGISSRRHPNQLQSYLDHNRRKIFYIFDNNLPNQQVKISKKANKSSCNLWLTRSVFFYYLPTSFSGTLLHRLDSPTPVISVILVLLNNVYFSNGPQKKYTPRGFIRDKSSNAVWGMQFVWPIEAEYRITYLDADYTITVIGRTKRDYVWIMSRSRTISEQNYKDIIQLLASQGYDVEKVQRIPQRLK